MSKWPIVDYPKTQCVFKRKDIDGHHCVYPELNDGMDWVFDDGVRAVDKLHGTNTCILVDDNKMVHFIDNRTQRIVNQTVITQYGVTQARFVKGLINAFERGWITEPGRIYGELVGPNINGNLHGVNDYFFVPFSYLREKCAWKSWSENRYPKDFDSISEWFKELPSLFAQRHGTKCLAEGLVFHHPDGRVAKLRRDMFPWFYQ